MKKLGETIDGITCGLGKRIRFVNEIITKHNLCKNNPNCYYKQLKRKEQECEELRRYHNKCCEENTEKLKQWLEKYNQLSRDFYNGKYCNKENCSLLKAKEQECEELKKELQAQRAFTAHEQKLIYCVAYDESCKTGNDCKQKKCIFKDNIKLKQTLTEIKDICKTNVCKHCHSKFKVDDNYCKNIKDCDCYKILQKISECEVEND